MRAQAILVVFVIAMTSLFGCSSSGDTPIEVAQNFWSAMEERDIEKARSFATEETAGSVKINDEAGDQEVDIVFGEVSVEDDRAVVATTMVNAGDDSEMKIAMETVLVVENDMWKVDVDQTFMSLFGGAVGAMMEQMGEAMKEGMSKSLEDLADIGGKVQEAAVRAGYGPTIRADAVKKLVESVVNFQARSRDIIEEMRVLATRNAEEIRESVEDGKQRLARLIQQGGTLPPPTGV